MFQRSVTFLISECWFALFVLVGFGMGYYPQAGQAMNLHDASAVVWAVNLGGATHQSADGVAFKADDHASATGSQLAEVLGAQDSTIYQTYRAGEISLSRSLPNGTYDLTLYFAEPHGAEPSERVFDVLAQGRTVINQLDVSQSRSSSAPSALSEW